MPYSVGIIYFKGQDNAAQVGQLSDKLLVSQSEQSAADSHVASEHV